MSLRTFLFLLFITSTTIFLVSSYNPELIERVRDAITTLPLTLEYIKINAMVLSALSLILYVIADTITRRRVQREKERLLVDRLNIEKIHNELEALKSNL